MPRTILFHLDENCSKAIATALRLRGIDVTTTPEAGLRGATDAEQTAFASRQDRVIVTRDRDFLRLHAAGVPHAGIAYFDMDRQAIGELIDALVLLWEVYGPSEMTNRVEYL